MAPQHYAVEIADDPLLKPSAGALVSFCWKPSILSRVDIIGPAAP